MAGMLPLSPHRGGCARGGFVAKSQAPSGSLSLALQSLPEQIFQGDTGK